MCVCVSVCLCVCVCNLVLIFNIFFVVLSRALSLKRIFSFPFFLNTFFTFFTFSLFFTHSLVPRRHEWSGNDPDNYSYRGDCEQQVPWTCPHNRPRRQHLQLAHRGLPKRKYFFLFIYYFFVLVFMKVATPTPATRAPWTTKAFLFFTRHAIACASRSAYCRGVGALIVLTCTSSLTWA